MQLSLQSFSGLVQGMGAAVQTAATQALDLTVGSTLRAILEANASVALWMQWLILQVLQMTRAATSSGGDLDSWMADFSLLRLPASPASGTVTFARFTPTIAALIPPGTQVRTADGTQIFAVTTDTTNTAWSASQTGYIVGPGVASLDVPVTAQNPGTAGNVQAEAITLLAAALPGIDTVANALPLINGIDAESDTAFRSRFQNFMSTRSRATPLSIGNAIVSVQQGLNYIIQENVTPQGNPLLGNFVVTVDDGSGAPSTALLSAVQQAIETVRPVGSTFAVLAPIVTQVTVSLVVTVSATGNISTLTSSIVAAITAYINGLTIGSALPAARIVQLVLDVDPAIINVMNVLLNGSTSDIVVPPRGVAKLANIVVN